MCQRTLKVGTIIRGTIIEFTVYRESAESLPSLDVASPSAGSSTSGAFWEIFCGTLVASGRPQTLTRFFPAILLHGYRYDTPTSTYFTPREPARTKTNCFLRTFCQKSIGRKTGYSCSRERRHPSAIYCSERRSATCQAAMRLSVIPPRSRTRRQSCAFGTGRAGQHP